MWITDFLIYKIEESKNKKKNLRKLRDTIKLELEFEIKEKEETAPEMLHRFVRANPKRDKPLPSPNYQLLFVSNLIQNQFKEKNKALKYSPNPR